MDKRKQHIKLTKDDKAVIREISRLRKSVPAYWLDVVAEKMGKSVSAIRAYSNGTRGIKEGSHIQVLRILKEIIEKKNREIKCILS